MNCSQCGEVCYCHSDPPPAELTRWRPDAESPLASAEELASSSGPSLLARETECVDGEATAELVNSAAQSADLADEHAEAAADESDASAWRDELSARLNRYRARRKMSPPRYPSLRLQFDAVESLTSPPLTRHDTLAASSPPAFAPASDHALALDGLVQDHPADGDMQLRDVPGEETVTQVVRPPVAHTGAKIIEFPRFNFDPPAPPPDQLAEPVSDRPRILEAPEVEPPPPALGGITIEPAQREDAEKRPGIDIPLQSASPVRRVVASAIDGIIIATASVLFGWIFWQVAAIRPPVGQLLGLGAGVLCLLWAVYQYLLIVYAGSTPGLRAAGLELARFDGSSTSRSLRRWRVLASYLSAASLGMGYAWVFLDEDSLCWHDRTTHTYLAPKRPQSKREESRKA